MKRSRFLLRVILAVMLILGTANIISPFPVFGADIFAPNITLGIQLGHEYEFVNQNLFWGSQEAWLNGESVALSARPFTVGLSGISYVPVRDMANVFGLNIYYGDHDQLLTVDEGSSMLILSRYDGGVRYNGNYSEEVSREYILINNRAYVPLRLLAEGQGFHMEYDTVKNQVFISSQKNKGDTHSNIALGQELEELGQAVDNTTFMPEVDFKATIPYTVQPVSGTRYYLVT